MKSPKILKLLFVFLALFVFSLLSACDQPECKHDRISHKTVDPTHNECGYTEFTCPDCNYSYTEKYIDPTPHSYKKTVTEPTCNLSGSTLYECDCGHSYVSDIVAPLGHSYVKTVTEPTCTEGGYSKYTCPRCSDSYVSNITDAKGHSYNTSLVVEPTCTEQGYTTFTCSCGYSFRDDLTAPSGHEYVPETISEANCTDKGEIRYTCACGSTYTVITPPTGHEYSRLVMMPTLSDMGYTTYTCSLCEHSYTGDLTFYGEILPDAYADSSAEYTKGIDISYHNYTVDQDGEYVSLDWESIKKAGVTYVIIRLGDASIGIDPTLEKSYSEAKEAGLDVGFYFYTRATSVSEITLEANLILSALEGKQFEYPVYLDLEDESLRELGAPLLNEMCVTFFTLLQRSGYYTGLYVNDEWLYNVIDTESALSHFDIWYARYPTLAEGEEYVWSVEEYGQPHGMWQYTDSGRIEGIDHTVFDLNYCYKDYPTIIKEHGFNGYESDLVFPDTEKSFVWIIYDGTVKIRSKNDYFTSEGYDQELDVIGYASYGTRFEVVEQNELYTAIIYNGEIAYISANPQYVSFTGIYNK